MADVEWGVRDKRGEWQPEADAAEYLLDRFNRPRARIDLGRELLGQASAAIDISDGLLADAGHIANASGVRLVIEPSLLPLSRALSSHRSREQVMRWALAGGDDYELCFTLAEADPAPHGCTRIGQVEAGEGVDCGLAIDIPGGYQHF